MLKKLAKLVAVVLVVKAVAFVYFHSDNMFCSVASAMASEMGDLSPCRPEVVKEP